MTKTCSQCGAILPSSVRACSFCDSTQLLAPSISSGSGALGPDEDCESAWRSELAQRLEAYRTRRKKSRTDSSQSQLPFEAAPLETLPKMAAALADPPTGQEDFSFTIAIGRTANDGEDDPRMVIDVSLPLDSREGVANAATEVEHRMGLYPVAPVEDRRLAALADAGCLLFAYGAFLALFGSVGGQFTLSKLGAVVCTATLALVYVQYFALFTIFGGTTPGMMLRGLQVVSLSGETPTPRQMLLRSIGYMLSAGALGMGFLWAMWDEDSLTWHDRMSRTYLCPAHSFADMEAPTAAHSR